MAYVKFNHEVGLIEVNPTILIDNSQGQWDAKRMGAEFVEILDNWQIPCSSGVKVEIEEARDDDEIWEIMNETIESLNGPLGRHDMTLAWSAEYPETLIVYDNAEE